MRLAAEPIIVLSLRDTVELRPSLRAATRLARRYAGYADLFRGVIDGNTTIIADLVFEGTGDRQVADNFLYGIADIGLGRWHAENVGTLAEYVLALIGHDGEQDAAPTGKLIPFEDYHTQLFKIAAGQLGWPPEDAWNATPTEIIAAYEGRCDLLRSIFGGSTDATPSEYVPPVLDENGQDTAFDRAGFAALKAKYQAARQ